MIIVFQSLVIYRYAYIDTSKAFDVVLKLMCDIRVIFMRDGEICFVK